MVAQRRRKDRREAGEAPIPQTARAAGWPAPAQGVGPSAAEGLKATGETCLLLLLFLLLPAAGDSVTAGSAHTPRGCRRAGAPPPPYLRAAAAEVHQRRRGLVNLAAIEDAAAGENQGHPLAHGALPPAPRARAEPTQACDLGPRSTLTAAAAAAAAPARWEPARPPFCSFGPARRSGAVGQGRCCAVSLAMLLGLCIPVARLKVALLPVGPRRGSAVYVWGWFVLRIGVINILL